MKLPQYNERKALHMELKKLLALKFEDIDLTNIIIYTQITYIL
jgi:hypothetical protein